VDVLLVLLIIFMVGAPLAISGVDVNLPTGNSKSLSMNSTPIVISIDNNGEIYLKEKKVTLKTLPQKMRALGGNSPDKPLVYIRADRAVSYGRVMEVMAICQTEGFTKMGMMNQLTNKSK
jgi:biopolymer transport protein TolR